MTLSLKPALQPVAFHIPRDEYLVDENRILGKGAYGVVCSATHVPSGRKVAVKKIMPFQHSLMCIRTLREIRLLRHFRHENIISIYDVVKPMSYSAFTEVYLVQELMPVDLEQVLRTQRLSDDHCQYFIYQVLRGLKAIHSAGVLHRDLKPGNLLVDEECGLKICDFGLARAEIREDGLMTEYVATRWYRAPEIMLTSKEYTRAIDMWSVGCILAEMLNGKVLFPGKVYHQQLALIFQTLGSPSEADFLSIKSRRAREYIRSMPIERRTPWKIRFPYANDAALNLLDRLLTFNPQMRIEADVALKHPYIAGYHDPADEPTSQPVVDPLLLFDRNGLRPDKSLLKRKLSLCVSNWNPG